MKYGWSFVVRRDFMLKFRIIVSIPHVNYVCSKDFQVHTLKVFPKKFQSARRFYKNRNTQTSFEMYLSVCMHRSKAQIHSYKMYVIFTTFVTHFSC